MAPAVASSPSTATPMLSTALSPLWDLLLAIQHGLPPTLYVLLFNPWILLRPTELSRLFFSKVWIPFGDGVDEGGAEVKEGMSFFEIQFRLLVILEPG